MELSTKLSTYFTLKDLVHSDIADRNPKIAKEQYEEVLKKQEVLDNLELLSVIVLDKVKTYLVNKGYSMYITSGYRCPTLNKLVKGSKTSDHLYGRAADIIILQNNGSRATGDIYYAVLEYLDKNIGFYQAIWEFGSLNNPSWLHISYRRGDSKKQILRIGADTNNKYVQIDLKYLYNKVIKKA